MLYKGRRVHGEGAGWIPTLNSLRHLSVLCVSAATFFQEHSPLRRRGRRRREKIEIKTLSVSLKLGKNLVKKRRSAHFALARIGAREHCAVPAIHYIQVNIELIQDPHRQVI